MALISVVELTFDADFVDPVTVRRRVETVGDDGVAVYIIETHEILGSVQASGGDDLSLQPDGARSSSTYEIITAFPLQVATERTNSDLVIWRDMTFQVMSVQRFGNFAAGEGHYEATMDMMPVSTTEGPP
jgi:hypothetical protein